MNMIVHEGPSEDPVSRFLHQLPKAGKKVLPVFIIPEYVPALEAANHNMMKGAGGV
jgi:hypothetical protein